MPRQNNFREDEFLSSSTIAAIARGLPRTQSWRKARDLPNLFRQRSTQRGDEKPWNTSRPQTPYTFNCKHQLLEFKKAKQPASKSHSEKAKKRVPNKPMVFRSETKSPSFFCRNLILCREREAKHVESKLNRKLTAKQLNMHQEHFPSVGETTSQTTSRIAW